MFSHIDRQPFAFRARYNGSLCGIAGFTHLQRKPEPVLIRRAIESIHHRGPDQSGVYESEVLSMGAVRLKIIDLAGGEQPMRAGGCIIVFNGEIYNHAEIRNDLERRGVRFSSHCDTEVVLRGFLEWDIAVLSKLRGMFAFAIWNDRDQRLILARDRMGIKPLYIHRRGSDLYFGSELKTLFVHPEIKRRVDPAGLNLYCSMNYIPGEHTMVDGIRKLPPAHWLEWQDGRVRTERYWQAEWKPVPMDLESAKEELDGLLRDAVKEHLVSDVPLGIWASGGLDSSTVLHYAAETSSTRLKTFSVSFAGREFDESPWFREVAARYGTDHHEFDLNPEAEILDAIGKMPYFSDEPSSDAGALPVWFLSRMSRTQVTVALSGEGADELFGGYNTYLADRYARTARLVPGFARRGALQALRLWPASDAKIGLDYKVKRMLEGSLLDPEQAHFFWNGTLSESHRQELITSDFFRKNAAKGLGGGGYLNQFLLLDQHNYLPDDILYKCDRMSMAHSLEVRPPFLDHRIVEFAARVPQELKIRGPKLKYLLRALMNEKLPQSVLTRRKEGFDIPAHAWFRGTLKPLLQDTITPERVRQTGLFRWEAIDALMQDHFERRANYGYHLWGLLTLFLWINRWGIESGTASSLSSLQQSSTLSPAPVLPT